MRAREDRRREQGYSDGVAEHYDWLRGDAEFSGEWGGRDRWREWFENEASGDPDAAGDRLPDLRELYIDRVFEARVSGEAVEDRPERGLRRLVETFGTERILDAIDDGEIVAHVSSRPSSDFDSS